MALKKEYTDNELLSSIKSSAKVIMVFSILTFCLVLMIGLGI